MKIGRAMEECVDRSLVKCSAPHCPQDSLQGPTVCTMLVLGRSARRAVGMIAARSPSEEEEEEEEEDDGDRNVVPLVIGRPRGHPARPQRPAGFLPFRLPAGGMMILR